MLSNFLVNAVFFSELFSVLQAFIHLAGLAVRHDGYPRILAVGVFTVHTRLQFTASGFQIVHHMSQIVATSPYTTPAFYRKMFHRLVSAKRIDTVNGDGLTVPHFVPRHPTQNR